jgi:tRNA(Ile)-lysidine synthase
MVLLDILVQCGYEPVVAHFNHQLRSSASSDADFVRRRAGEYGLAFMYGSADVGMQAQASGQGIEEAARNARYRFLFATAEEQGAAALAVAHQADDQVETVLLNLLRGSGLKGLGGMRMRSQSPFHVHIPLVRPLLNCWRTDILTYAQERELPYMNDESNQDNTYRRNRVRLELLPELESYNPQIKHAIHQMADLLAGDMEFIDTACLEAARQVNLQSREGYAELDLREFKQLSAAVQRGLIRKVLAEAFPREGDLGAIHFELARCCLTHELESLNVQLNNNVLVRVENERGVFMDTEAARQPAAEWPCIEQEIHLPAVATTIELSLGWVLSAEIIDKEILGDVYRSNADDFSAYLAMEKLTPELHLRTWQTGDRYQPMGMQGREQKLSDFWINHKVPLRAKGHWPLLFSGGNLIWIPGFPPSQLAKVTDETHAILYLRVYKREDHSSAL